MAKATDSKLILSKEEAKLLAKGEYNLIPNEKGIFLLISKELEGKGKAPTGNKELDEEKQKIIGMINKEKLSDLVEGKFEKKLNEKQKKSLLELVASGKVFVFKLSNKYKKGVYRVKKEGKTVRESKATVSVPPEKEPDEYGLEKDGLVVLKGEARAKKICSEKEKEIKEGTLRGIKSFDGNYYIIENNLLETYLGKAIKVFKKEPSQKLEEVARNLKVPPTVAKIVCEFLKDEGELIERRKEQYSYVS